MSLILFRLASLRDCLDVQTNDSLSSGSFPTVIKSAIVRPLLKKTSLDPNCLKKYGPVSNLSFLSKISESIVLSLSSLTWKKNNLLNPHQSACRLGHSTETALLRVVNDLLLGLDDDKVSILALFDLSAVFDTTAHSILLTRLQHSFGICDLALAWFRSYLTDRQQTACVNGIYFEPSAPMYGVPKGSVFGPILFLLYATPVSDIINYHLLHHEGFADNTQLHTSPHITELD